MSVTIRKARTSDVPAMQRHIAEDLVVPVTAINVKATTTERLGFEGREEGIAAQAIVLLQTA